MENQTSNRYPNYDKKYCDFNSKKIIFYHLNLFIRKKLLINKNHPNGSINCKALSRITNKEFSSRVVSLIALSVLSYHFELRSLDTCAHGSCIKPNPHIDSVIPKAKAAKN